MACIGFESGFWLLPFAPTIGPDKGDNTSPLTGFIIDPLFVETAVEWPTVPFGENAKGVSGIVGGGGGPVVKYVGPESKSKLL